SDETGNPIIARPIFNVVADREAAFVDSLPSLLSGGAIVDAKSELFGGEFNMRCHYCCTDCFRIEGLFGFRYVHLAESINVEDQITPLASGVLTFNGNPVNPPSTLADQDFFQTTNNFYGLQLGTRFLWDGDWCTITTFGKVAVGANDETVKID